MDRENAADTMVRLRTADHVLGVVENITEDPEVADYIKSAHGQVRKAMGICIAVLEGPPQINGKHFRLSTQ